MRYFVFSLPSILALFINVEAVPLVPRQPTGFVNKGLVAFGLIPASAKDSTGDTLGGFGSAVAIKRGTFRKQRKVPLLGVLSFSPIADTTLKEPLIGKRGSMKSTLSSLHIQNLIRSHSSRQRKH
ncbi:hypothetical protein FRC03_008165 [Tulasnella sp. 419]|nr:hypothetical protein FRC03_008165 [Tulasnella sp. 419]